MSEIKLLPCPFCGGEKVISTYNNFVPALLCGGCGAMMTIPMSFGDTYEDKERELLRKWNTRIPMQEIVERLEESKGTVVIDGKEMYQEDYFIDIDEAIQIVKEVGGMNVQENI